MDQVKFVDDSCNVNEVIRAFLNLFIFFYEKISRAQAQKRNQAQKHKRHKDAQAKAKNKNKRISEFFPLSPE